MLFFFFCPNPDSLTLTFLLALPPTQYEGSRLNEEVSEGEEGTALVLSALCVFLPPFVRVQTRRWASDDMPWSSAPGSHDLKPLNCLSQHLPSSVWCFVLTTFLHTVYAMFGVCVLNSPVGAVYPVCCDPDFKVLTFDAFTVATVRQDRLDTRGQDASIRRRHSISVALNPVDLVYCKVFSKCKLL